MNNKTFVIVLGVAVVFLALVAVVSKQSSSPLLKELIAQQSQIIANQQNASGGSQTDVAALELRVKTLEDQWKGLQMALKQAAPTAQAPRQAPPAEDYSKQYDIPVAHSPLKGDKNASVTVVEFVDFECPFCARFHPPVAQAVNSYKPSQVNYMVKNFPLSFHPNAKPASKAALAAGEQGKYFEMVDKLLENGRSLNEAKFIELATGLGLNVEKFQKDLKDNDAKYEDIINKDMALGTKVGVRGTPTFYIDGKKTRSRDLNSLKAEIDGILKEKGKL